mmetsp:Transcript_29855/g.68183  ORF Transcript_29855/g.68183 Transcript_29855/m.68183 type:complete len:240 (-) Transcript_29855:138-857(-)
MLYTTFREYYRCLHFVYSSWCSERVTQPCSKTFFPPLPPDQSSCQHRTTLSTPPVTSTGIVQCIARHVTKCGCASSIVRRHRPPFTSNTRTVLSSPQLTTKSPEGWRTTPLTQFSCPPNVARQDPPDDTDQSRTVRSREALASRSRDGDDLPAAPAAGRALEHRNDRASTTWSCPRSSHTASLFPCASTTRIVRSFPDEATRASRDDASPAASGGDEESPPPLGASHAPRTAMQRTQSV